MNKIILCLLIFLFNINAFAKSEKNVEPINYKSLIQIVVAFAPGGDTDIISRAIAKRLSERLNTNVVVVNKPGAGGIIGNSIVANSKADGSVLLFTPSTLITSAVSNPKQVKYNVLTDFSPIIEVTTNTTMLLAVNSDLNINNINELVAAIKDGRIRNYSSPGKGSPMNMVGEYLKNVLNITNIEHVPYQGNSPAINALLSGEVPFAISSGLSLMPYVKTGRVTVIGSATDIRSSFFPDVKTLHEQGLPKADFSGLFALLGPKGMDNNMVKDLNFHVAEILKEKDFKDLLISLTHNPGGGSPDELQIKMNNIHKRFSAILLDYNINVN
jgi:tripartite-type tricarboxylate transporter receptor subunit TctC